MTSNFLLILSAVLAALFIWAAAELYVCFVEASRLRDGVSKLIDNASPEEAFPGSTHLQKRAAAVARKAQELGLTIDDVTDEANTNRISIKTAVSVGRDLLPHTRMRSINCWQICPGASGSSISWRHRGL